MFKNGAIQHLRAHLEEDNKTPSLRMLDLRREFPDEWHRFLHPTSPAAGNVFELELSPVLFRLIDTGKTLKINSIILLARCTDDGAYQMVATPPLPPPPPAGSNSMSMAKLSQWGGLHFGQRDVSAAGIEVTPHGPNVTWLLRMNRPGGGNLELDPVTQAMEVQDLMLIFGFEWE